MDITTAYKTMADEYGIEEGDTVRVLRTAEAHEMGWPDSWTSSMIDSVGKEFVVERVSDTGKPYLSGCWYPFFVLEIVKKVEPEPVETIALMGKEYSKAEIETALSTITPVK